MFFLLAIMRTCMSCYITAVIQLHAGCTIIRTMGTCLLASMISLARVIPWMGSLKNTVEKAFIALRTTMKQFLLKLCQL
jgi:hypothetical protein